jgi:hypothetical protein
MWERMGEGERGRERRGESQTRDDRRSADEGKAATAALPIVDRTEMRTEITPLPRRSRRNPRHPPRVPVPGRTDTATQAHVATTTDGENMDEAVPHFSGLG